MVTKFTRNGEVLRKMGFLLESDMPKINEVLTLPGSKRKHKVTAILKKYKGQRGSTRIAVKEVEIILGPVKG